MTRLAAILAAFLLWVALPQPAQALLAFRFYDQNDLSRYTDWHLLAVYTDFDPIKCTLISPGAWTVSTKPKYGQLKFGYTSFVLTGRYCNGMAFTGAAIYYKWTLHSNAANVDPFLAIWKGKTTGGPNFNAKPSVPIVRPIGESTRFVGWRDTRGLWEQRLIPPEDDPTFDFTGETVREQSNGNFDQCYDGRFRYGPAGLSPHEWLVHDKVAWGDDGVGWGTNENLNGQCAVQYYRCMKRTPCGGGAKQQMFISSPADNGKFVAYGKVNTLTFFITGGIVGFSGQGYGDVTSRRGDSSPRQSKFQFSAPFSCPNDYRFQC